MLFHHVPPCSIESFVVVVVIFQLVFTVAGGLIRLIPSQQRWIVALDALDSNTVVPERMGNYSACSHSSEPVVWNTETER